VTGDWCKLDCKIAIDRADFCRIKRRVQIHSSETTGAGFHRLGKNLHKSIVTSPQSLLSYAPAFSSFFSSSAASGAAAFSFFSFFLSLEPSSSRMASCAPSPIRKPAWMIRV